MLDLIRIWLFNAAMILLFLNCKGEVTDIRMCVSDFRFLLLWLLFNLLRVVITYNLIRYPLPLLLFSFFFAKFKITFVFHSNLGCKLRSAMAGFNNTNLNAIYSLNYFITIFLNNFDIFTFLMLLKAKLFVTLSPDSFA